jgi:ABC-type amino acid transport substrate-binding protein
LIVYNVSNLNFLGKITLKNFLLIIIYLLVTLFVATTKLSAQESKTVYLNDKERIWLDKLSKSLTVGITLIPNQVLLAKDGTYKGFSIDLFHIIEEKLGIKFKYVYFKTWDALVKSVENGEIDILFSAQKTSLRLHYLDFTDTVLRQQNKIIVNIQNDHYNSIESLFKRKVAVTAGSAIEGFLKATYPEIILVPAKDELAILKMLHNEKVDAAISESVRASYYIKKYNLNNLRIASDLKYDYHLSIGSLREFPTLNVVLSKTITSISKEQLEALQLKWGYTKDKVVFFNKQMLIYIGLVFGIIFPFSIYLYLINRKLQREIIKRKKTIKELQLMRKSRLTQMSEIISMIAHQWKQPLNNLSLVNQLLISKYRKGKVNDTVIERFKENSTKQINFMSNTIDDFRNFFKVEQVKMEFDLKDTIYHVIDVSKPTLSNFNINLTHYVNEEESFKMFA